MITLGANDTIQASTTTTATVNAVIKGLLLTDTIPPVVTQYQTLSSTGLQVATSAGLLYGPGASASAMVSSVYLYNTSASIPQVVALYINGTAAADQIAGFTIPVNGWAQYEDGSGWNIYSATGVLQFVGTTGAAGPQGAAGATGSTGPTGPTGPNPGFVVITSSAKGFVRVVSSASIASVSVQQSYAMAP